MPESKGRSKPAYTPPRTAQKNTTPNPRWFVPLMLGLMIVGLLWVSRSTSRACTSSRSPRSAAGTSAVGFGLMFAGFLMTTRWR